MNQPLIVRYTSDWPSPITPMGELFYEGPRRDRMMIALAQQQLAAQKETARQITLSQLAGAQAIVDVLDEQTNTLAAEIEELKDRLLDGLSEATERITYAVDRLGDRICASFDEMRWQLVQQGKALDQILMALVESRNNEAQQLVRQGVRLSANEEYEEAEQVFKEALEKNRTDYQVLMNLAFIEIHKGDAHAAFDYFRKALTRPDPSCLGAAAKARALWAMARLHYAEGQYTEALKTANRALALEETPTGDALFTVGVYAGRAGDADLCLKAIRDAIEIDPSVFAKAATAPSFGKMRTEVLRMLAEMAGPAYKGKRAVADARKALEEVANAKHVSSYEHLLVTVRQKIDQCERLLESASYTDPCDVCNPLREVREVIAEISSLERLCQDVARAKDEARQRRGTQAAKEAAIGKVMELHDRIACRLSEIEPDRPTVPNGCPREHGRPAVPNGRSRRATGEIRYDDTAKASCDVVLVGFGGAKLNVVKAVKTLTGVSLMDAKHLVESTPATILQDVPREIAEKTRNVLVGVGATVELR